MNRDWARAACIMIALSSVSPVIGRAQDLSPADWPDLQRVCAEAGVNSKDVEEIMLRCQKNDLSVEQTFSLLSPVCKASQKGLSTGPLTQKIEEGLSKGVAPQIIVSAVEQRAGYLQSAKDLAQSIQPKLCVDEVVIPAAFALESGLSRDVVESVMETGRDTRAREIRAALEAGEALHLAGFSSLEIEPILMDCLNRNLRRLEFKKVVRYATQQRNRGMEAQRIRQSLWGNGAQESQQQHQHREQHGEDHGGGPGPRGPSHGGHGQP